MRKGLIFIFILLLIGAAYLLASSRKGKHIIEAASQSGGYGGAKSSRKGAENSPIGLSSLSEANNASGYGEESSSEEEFDVKPATELYRSAEEALAAVEKGAKDYDDLILEQFVTPSLDCPWCDEFYQKIKEKLFDKNLDEDRRGYYAELLAISGRAENLNALVQGILQAENSDEADIYAEALEFAEGGDVVVTFLAPYLNSQNDILQEAAVAAITNQTTRLAAETLYKHTVEKGDAGGYYDLGIGLGEMVPDKEALPFLQEVALKRDQYSHLAVKALINQGLEGLQMVFDIVTNSPNPEFDRNQLLKDAVDHVYYEEEIEEFVKNVYSSTKDPLVKEFAGKILKEFKEE